MRFKKEELEIILEILEQLPLKPIISIERVQLIQHLIQTKEYDKETNEVLISLSKEQTNKLLEFILNEEIKMQAPLAYAHATILSKIEAELNEQSTRQ